MQTGQIEYGCTADGLYLRFGELASREVCSAVDRLVSDYLAVHDNPPRVAINLTSCDWVDSTFAGWLVGLRKRLSGRGGSVCLAELSPGCRQSLDRMNIGGLFEQRAVSAPDHTRALTHSNEALNDPRVIEMMAAAHEDLAAVNDENRRVFGPIAAMLRGQLEQRRS